MSAGGGDVCSDRWAVSCRELGNGYLKASNADPYDRFGVAVSMWGDTLVVGAPNEDSSASGIDGDGSDNQAAGSGAVYVFVRVGETWKEQAYLKAPHPGTSGFLYTGDAFGGSVSLWGDTLAVGAHWEDSASAGIDGDQTNDNLEGSGAVYVFTRSEEQWSQQAYLKASNPGESDNFGASVSLWEETLVVGAPDESSSAMGLVGDQESGGLPGSGAVYVFTRTGAQWSQQAHLKASAPDAYDAFGWSLSLSENALAVGAPRESSSGEGGDSHDEDNGLPESGAVYVFTRTGAQWSQQAYLKASNPGENDFFGHCVSLSGNTLAVGAYSEDSSARGPGGDQSDNGTYNGGAAYVFTRTGQQWSQQAYLKASNTDVDPEFPSNTKVSDGFGWSVALLGDTLAVGAPGEDSTATGVGGDEEDNGAEASGAVYLFARKGNNWEQTSYLKATSTDAGARFGVSVSLSDSSIAVGSPEEASGVSDVVGERNDNRAEGSGAVFVSPLTP